MCGVRVGLYAELVVVEDFGRVLEPKHDVESALQVGQIGLRQGEMQKRLRLLGQGGESVAGVALIDHLLASVAGLRTEQLPAGFHQIAAIVCGLCAVFQFYEADP